VPAGSILAGAAVRVVNPAGRTVPDWPGQIALVATSVSAGGTTSLAVSPDGFWGALPPGTYAVRLDGLSPPFSVKSLTAGSVDLTKAALVVPDGRPAEQIEIVLEVSVSKYPVGGVRPD
jgi:hypothetical protein